MTCAQQQEMEVIGREPIFKGDTDRERFGGSDQLDPRQLGSYRPPTHRRRLACMVLTHFPYRAGSLECIVVTSYKFRLAPPGKCHYAFVNDATLSLEPARSESAGQPAMDVLPLIKRIRPCTAPTPKPAHRTSCQRLEPGPHRRPDHRQSQR